MATGLERHVERGSACRVAGAPQSDDLGVRTAESLVVAGADELAVANHDGADQRVRLDRTSALGRPRAGHDASSGRLHSPRGLVPRTAPRSSRRGTFAPSLAALPSGLGVPRGGTGLGLGSGRQGRPAAPPLL